MGIFEKLTNKSLVKAISAESKNTIEPIRLSSIRKANWCLGVVERWDSAANTNPKRIGTNHNH